MVRLTVLAAVLAATASPVLAKVGQRCGYKIASCTTGLVCVPDEPTCTEYGRCGGTCQKKPTEYRHCGGFSPKPLVCLEGETCIPDVRNKDFELIPDLPGICVKLDKIERCGGPGIVAPKPCSGGGTQHCYDDPTDECDPDTSSIGCGGICIYKSPMYPGGTPPTNPPPTDGGCKAHKKGGHKGGKNGGHKGGDYDDSYE